MNREIQITAANIAKRQAGRERRPAQQRQPEEIEQAPGQEIDQHPHRPVLDRNHDHERGEMKRGKGQEPQHLRHRQGCGRAQPVRQRCDQRRHGLKSLDQTGVDQQPVEAPRLSTVGAAIEQPAAAFENLLLLGK